MFDLEQGAYKRCRFDHEGLGNTILLFKLDTIRPKKDTIPANKINKSDSDGEDIEDEVKVNPKAMVFSDDEDAAVQTRKTMNEVMDQGDDAVPNKMNECVSSGEADADYRARQAEEELYLQTDKDHTEEINVGDYVASKFGHERQLYSGEIIAIKPRYKPRNSDVEIDNPTPYQLMFDDRTQPVWKRRDAITKIDDSSFNLGDRKLVLKSPVYWVRYGGGFGLYKECSIKYYNQEKSLRGGVRGRRCC